MTEQRTMQTQPEYTSPNVRCVSPACPDPDAPLTHPGAETDYLQLFLDAPIWHQLLVVAYISLIFCVTMMVCKAILR
jgi:hypothetical protein